MTSPVTRTIDRTAVVQAFLDALSAHGIMPSDPSRIELDGTWHRLHVDGDRRGSENLSYRIYFDDRPAGYFECHKRGVTGTFSVAAPQNLSPAERAAQQARWRETAAQREAEREQAYSRAAQEAVATLATAVDDPAGHAYLIRKGLKPTTGLRRIGSLLYVPLLSELPATVASYQTISEDGTKLFLEHGRIAGSFHAITGTDKRRVLVCEGYATGAALNAATGHPVACAMSAGNLPAIVAKMRRAFPERVVVACGDNDHHTAARTGKNPGADAAHAAGTEHGAVVFLPEFAPDDAGTDWDDWLRQNPGADLMAMLDEACVHPAPAPEPTITPTSTPEAAAEFQPVPERPQRPASDNYSALLNWTELDLVLGDRGSPVPNLDNASRVLQRHPSFIGAFWYDEFLQRTLSTWGAAPGAEPYEWSDTDDVRLTLWMQRAMGIGKIAVGTIADAVRVVSHANARNEVQDWLQELQWDGEQRIGDLFALGFGVARTEYTEAVSRCFMLGMVARALTPGCKLDNMPVLEGPQGIGKSTGLRYLVGNRWFAEASESPLSKDFYQCLTGKLLVEIAEMDAFSRAETKVVKRVISCQTDRYRAPYGRRAEDHPRSSAFAGTTNEDEYLKDETGARRFWPVLCTAVDLDWISRHREQLFAEAVRAIKAGSVWWSVLTADATREQASRRITDEWEPLIEDHLTGKWETTVSEVLRDLFKLPPDSWDRLTQMRVAAALKALGWNRLTARRDGRAQKVWRKPDSEGGMQSDILL